MLTDYHWHLREDGDDSPPESFAFTAENVDRYIAAGEEAGVAELGCSEHVYQFREALGLWRHPYWEQQARDDLDAYCEFVRTTPLRLGIEVDFVPGAEDRTRNLIEERDFDYVLGSVHFLGDRAVDMEGSTAGLRKPAGEMYPAPALGRMCVEAGAAFSLSSDAHTPAEIGYAYDRAVKEMRSWGVEEIAAFEHRTRRLEPL